jgi:hypothetical protein
LVRRRQSCDQVAKLKGENGIHSRHRVSPLVLKLKSLSIWL